MNPSQLGGANNSNKYYQQSLSYMESVRDKTKSTLQPSNFTNMYTPMYTYQQNNPSLILQGSQLASNNNIKSNTIPSNAINYSNNSSMHNSFINPQSQQPQIGINNYSDKYRSYYTEQVYAQDKSKEKSFINNQIKKHQTKNHHFQNVFANDNLSHNRSTILPHSPSFVNQDKSLERKRFLTTVTSKSPNHGSGSSSMISPKVSSRPYQFAAHKLSISKVDSQKQQKKYEQKSKDKKLPTQNSQNYTKYSSSKNKSVDNFLQNDKNKKISLKRDIISPRYEQFEKQKKLSLIEQRSKFDIPQTISKTYSNQFLQSERERQYSTESNFKKRSNYYFSEDSSLMKMEKLQIEDKNGKGLYDKNKQAGLKYNQEITKYDNSKASSNKRVLDMSQSQVKQLYPSSEENIISPKQRQVHGQQKQKANKTKQPQLSQQPSPQRRSKHGFPLVIDNDIYQDMKISRIEDATLGLEEKYAQLQKILQKLTKSDKLQQQEINSIKLTLKQHNNIDNKTTKRTVNGQEYHTNSNDNNTDYNHDLKRIKKQLKIIKNNFELAFTSMTEQINRKLVKEQQIMKNLSEEIKLVATENIKLSRSLQQKSSKVTELQRSMTSFMQENQQRIENLVLLNDSFSSTKNNRNRNNHSSFQYGLELKNMSGDEGWASSRDKQAVEGMKIRVDLLEKEIKKMKVYHMEEKEVNSNKLAQARNSINSLRIQVQKIKSERQQLAFLPHLVEKAIGEKVSELIVPQVQSMVNEKIALLKKELQNELKEVSESIGEIRKSVNEQLYEFRLGKLYPTESKGKGNHTNPNVNNNSNIDSNASSVTIDSKQLRQQLQQIEEKFHSVQKRLSIQEDKLFALLKYQEQHKMKQLKHSGDIRELQLLVKQLTSKSSQYQKFITQSQLNQYLDSIARQYRQSFVNMEGQIIEINRVNQIQTENIQSINSQFERVINKQIIPKFQQIHHNHLETQKKLTSIKFSVQDIEEFVRQCKQSHQKKRQNGMNMNLNSSSKNNGSMPIMDGEGNLRDKIQKYVRENIDMFINSKVKLFSSKMIFNKSPLAKLGLLNNLSGNNNLNNNFGNSLHNSNTSSQSGYEITNNQTFQAQVDKENTYLIDESGYLMDWEGCYLLEINSEGARNKIRVSEKEVYFMEVNGISIHQVTNF